MTVEPQRVRDYMQQAPLTVAPDMEVMHVISILVDNNVTGVPVVDGDDRVLGFVTERDCIQVALQVGYFDEVGGPVRNYMSTDLHTVNPEDSLIYVGELFANSRLRRCPVVEHDRLVGLISRRDILKALTQNA
ncbi:MAG: CBS domain-containing protein [Pseudomonadales bacterium]|nr:CBS domain-containing protein [Pseudomonadales bacterium]